MKSYTELATNYFLLIYNSDVSPILNLLRYYYDIRGYNAQMQYMYLDFDLSTLLNVISDGLAEHIHVRHSFNQCLIVTPRNSYKRLKYFHHISYHLTKISHLD